MLLFVSWALDFPLLYELVIVYTWRVHTQNLVNADTKIEIIIVIKLLKSSCFAFLFISLVHCSIIIWLPKKSGISENYNYHEATFLYLYYILGLSVTRFCASTHHVYLMHSYHREWMALTYVLYISIFNANCTGNK